MNVKTKNLLKIVVAVVAIALIALFYVVFTQNYVESATVDVYVANSNINAYEKMDEAKFNQKFSTKKISKTLKQEIPADFVASYSDIKDKETSTMIPKGTILLKEHFTNTVSKTRLSLPVDQSTLTSEGLSVSSTKYTTIVGYTTLAGTDVNGTAYNDAWLGILTNTAHCVSVTKNSSNEIVRATFELEDDACIGNLLLFSETAKLYYINGQLNDLSELSSGVLYDLYTSTSLGTAETFALSNSENELLAYNPGPSQSMMSIQESAKEGMSTDYNVPIYNEIPSISWRGLTASAYVYHYNSDGSRGDCYGFYTTTSNDSKYRLIYNSSTHETSLPDFSKQADTEYDGYYEVAVTIYNPLYSEKDKDNQPYTITYYFIFIIDTNKALTQNYTLYCDCSNNYKYTLINEATSYENVPFMEGYSGYNPLQNYYVSLLTYEQEETSFNIPSFNLDTTKKNTGLNPSNKQIEELKAYFPQNEALFNDASTIQYIRDTFSQKELSSIVDYLKASILVNNSSEADLDEISMFKTIENYVLSSLGFNVGKVSDFETEIMKFLHENSESIHKDYQDTNGDVVISVPVEFYNEEEEVSTYTVTFETNGGTQVESQTLSYNDCVEVPTSPTKEGYTFGGWYTDMNLEFSYDFETKVTKNLTLYAKWLPIDESEGD